MSSLASRTPGPWNASEENVGGGFNIYAGPLRVAHTSIQARVFKPEQRLLDESEAKANAVFIVRAVNSHDALVSALDDLLERYTRLVESGDAGFWDAEKEDEVIAARAALRAADQLSTDLPVCLNSALSDPCLNNSTSIRGGERV